MQEKFIKICQFKIAILIASDIFETSKIWIPIFKILSFIVLLLIFGTTARIKPNL